MGDKSLFLVFANPVEGKEREFNEWYDTVHVPELVATPGIVSAQRFDVHERAAERVAGAPPPPYRYLTVYEMDGDIDGIMAGIGEAVTSGEMTMSDALDRENVVMSFWTPRRSTVKP